MANYGTQFAAFEAKGWPVSRQTKDQVLYDAHNHSINMNLRDIYLHSYYAREDEEEPGVDYRQATTLVKNLSILDQPVGTNFKPILIHLHSIGGCWDNGMAIFNAIEFAQSEIRMLAYSQASSMSGIIFQSADTRVMMPDCHFLMHHGSSGLNPVHPFALQTNAEFGMKACKRMLSIFAEKAVAGPFFKKKKSSTVDTVHSFFDKKLKEKVDWLLTAEEAVFYGLADGILGSKEFPNVQCLRQEWE